jgi:hypothetical protein
VAIVPVDAVPRRGIFAKHFADGPAAFATLGRLRLDCHSVSDLEGHRSPPFNSLRDERTTSEVRWQPLQVPRPEQRAIAMRDEQGRASALERGADGNHRRSPGVHGLDDLGVIDALERHGGDALDLPRFAGQRWAFGSSC